jgi:hypothetical protein
MTPAKFDALVRANRKKHGNVAPADPDDWFRECRFNNGRNDVILKAVWSKDRQHITMRSDIEGDCVMEISLTPISASAMAQMIVDMMQYIDGGKPEIDPAAKEPCGSQTDKSEPQTELRITDDPQTKQPTE